MKVAEWQIALAEQLLSELQRAHPLRKPATLVWRNFRTTAGTATYGLNCIALGPKVLATPEQLAKTLRHEFAHLLAFEKYGPGGRGHGAAWCEMMRRLGEEPTVKHRYDCKRNESRFVVRYRCEKCAATFDRRRLFARGRVYVHATCGGRLRLLEKVPVAVPE